MKVIIVCGVASGASCAARLRRLDENAEIRTQGTCFVHQVKGVPG